ncbi:MAG: biopolymer transporter ExbD [Bacteroidales bacterium]|jgi:biopolymer transport protein ExbD|nr:biopolymer transporter ExbD [Bacteroidales bacterium]
MAEVQTGDHDKGKGGKPQRKKLSTRVDFTPMVDMNMLLITFFMFCTTLSKPQTMEIAMPPKTDEIKDDKQPPAPADLFVTLILDGENRAYYFEGKPNYEDPESLKDTDYSPSGIRELLLRRNIAINRQIDVLKQKLFNKEITQEEYKTESSRIKKETKDTPIVMIKPTEKATYKNLVDALDEMQISNIARYSVIDTTSVEKFLLANKFTGGHAAANSKK